MTCSLERATKIAMDMGLVVPVRTRVLASTPRIDYVIRIAGVRSGPGLHRPAKCSRQGTPSIRCPGEVTLEPVFGLAGKWVPSTAAPGEMTSATTINATLGGGHPPLLSIIMGKLRACSAKTCVCSRGVKVNPAAVDGIRSRTTSLAEVQRVLQGLLERSYQQRPPHTTEALSALRARYRDRKGLGEAARAALGPALSAGTSTVARLCT
jgi:flagellar biosynthesis protein FlhA